MASEERESSNQVSPLAFRAPPELMERIQRQLEKLQVQAAGLGLTVSMSEIVKRLVIRGLESFESTTD